MLIYLAYQWLVNKTNKFFKILINQYIFGKVLDRNLLLGNIILQNVINLLRYLPAPTIEESYQFVSKQLKMLNDNILVNFTIGVLNNHTRNSWISSFLIILYKV